jgi:hypothetical protein
VRAYLRSWKSYWRCTSVSDIFDLARCFLFRLLVKAVRVLDSVTLWPRRTVLLRRYASVDWIVGKLWADEFDFNAELEAINLTLIWLGDCCVSWSVSVLLGQVCWRSLYRYYVFTKEWITLL